MSICKKVTALSLPLSHEWYMSQRLMECSNWEHFFNPIQSWNVLDCGVMTNVLSRFRKVEGGPDLILYCKNSVKRWNNCKYTPENEVRLQLTMICEQLQENYLCMGLLHSDLLVFHPTQCLPILDGLKFCLPMDKILDMKMEEGKRMVRNMWGSEYFYNTIAVKQDHKKWIDLANTDCGDDEWLTAASKWREWTIPF